MNGTGGLPGPPAALRYHRVLPIGSRLWSLRDEALRQELLGVDAGASPLWLQAPPHLRRDYAGGRIDSGEFWRSLQQWLRFEERAA